MKPGTPLPWKTGTKERGRFCIYSAQHGRGICVMSNTQKISEWEREKYGEHGNNLDADANAAYAAHAANLYPELVEACQLALEHLADEYRGTFDSRMDNDPLVIRLRAALAKAEGGQQ